MKKIFCLFLTLVLAVGMLSVFASAKDYTEFNIVFEEKEGAKVNATVIKVFASVDDGKLTDRTDEFTMEDVKWYAYVEKPAAGKTADDYDYADAKLNVYGMQCSDDDVFEFGKYSYFLMISRLYAKEEDSFSRNISINGVDIEELNGTCYNTGNEFFIKTITNGMGGSAATEKVDTEAGNPEGGNGNSDSESEKHKCDFCGICPIQPLGICLFIWIAIILAIVTVAALAVTVAAGIGSRKNKKENKEENNEENKQ
ncbi:MAG: hypothetical protein MJ137_08305 [Clostridia bacterium]|nr:hypothetical protein [Clostridia bacterium]